MKVTHRFTAKAKCPENGGTDEYAVTVQTEQMITVEVIRAHADELGGAAIYQEDFTRQLAQRLEATVETRGMHGDFETVCAC